MSERSGVAAQIGVATEETVGTYKAPTRFFPFESESLVLTKEYIRSKGLRAGHLAQAKNLHLATTRSVGGDVALEFYNQGMGILMNLLHGEAITPVKVTESETAYKSTHKIGLISPYGKALTAQVGRPDTGGTVRAFSYLGCKVLSAKLSVDQGGVSMLTLTLDGKDEVTGEALGSASYSATAVPFTFQQVVAKIGGSEVANVRSITWNISIPQNTGRYNLGNSGTKLEPIINDLVEVTAEASLEFSSLADHERFKKEEVVKLEAIATGAVIDAKASFKAALTAPAAKQVSSGPTVQGPDILTTDVSFECLDNGTEAPLLIELINTDSTI
jgi:Phage tail tube protein